MIINNAKGAVTVDIGEKRGVREALGWLGEGVIVFICSLGCRMSTATAKQSDCFYGANPKRSVC